MGLDTGRTSTSVAFLVGEAKGVANMTQEIGSLCLQLVQVLPGLDITGNKLGVPVGGVVLNTRHFVVQQISLELLFLEQTRSEEVRH